MAEPKRGSVEAFRAAEERRKARVASGGKFKFPKIFPKLFSKKGDLLPKKVKEKRDAFNKKVAEVNKKRINQESVKKFKAAEDRRQIRLAKKNPTNKVIQAKVKKRIESNKNKIKAQANVEKDLPKSKINTTTATTVGTAIGSAGTKTPPTAKTSVQGKDKPNVKAAVSSFGEAFKKARAQGVGTKFAYNDKMYSAVTRDDISRAGKRSLKDFLNSTKRKDTKLAKAPGQVVNKKRGGGVDVEKAKEFRKNRKTPIRTFLKNTLEGKYSDDRRGTAEPRKTIGNRRISQGMKSGGSVMARGCRLGRKKSTKIY